jgi:hypothetical protein
MNSESPWQPQLTSKKHLQVQKPLDNHSSQPQNPLNKKNGALSHT